MMTNELGIPDDVLREVVKRAQDLRRYCLQHNIPKDAVIAGVKWDTSETSEEPPSYTDILSDLFTQVDDEVKCRGVYFRGSVYEGWDGRTYSSIIRLKLLKRMSCPGCEHCGWIYDQLHEVGPDWPLVGIEKVEDGKIYTIGVCNESKDWETGIVDQWDLEVVDLNKLAKVGRGS